MSKPAVNPLELSDEDFLKMNGPAPVEEEPGSEDEGDEEEEEAAEGAPAPEAGSDDPPEETASGEEEEDPDGGEQEGEEDPAPADDPADEGKSETPAEPEGKDPEGTSDKEGSKETGEKNEESGDKPDTTPVDYKTFYEQVMTPFKANGKTITLRDPAEVVQLMQMGANYTQKMQAIQPHRKVLIMLENNGLLDEGKLSYLVDLDKKDPAAIQKLIKDANIDPLDIDTDATPDYQPSNHSVSDEEAQFRDVMADVAATDTGKETLQVIDKTWDKASKGIIWEQPDVLKVIHEHREAGVYAQIVAEMDRKKTLGHLPANAPFLQTYQDTGNELAKLGAFGQPKETATSTPADTPKVPAAKKAAAPKPKVANGEQAKAASSTRSSSKQSKTVVNPLSMSDEEFLAMDNLKNRV